MGLRGPLNQARSMATYSSVETYLLCWSPFHSLFKVLNAFWLMITNSLLNSSHIFDAISLPATNKCEGECLVPGLTDQSFVQVSAWQFISSTSVCSVKYLEHIYRTAFGWIPDSIFNTNTADFKLTILEKDRPEEIQKPIRLSAGSNIPSKPTTSAIV